MYIQESFLYKTGFKNSQLVQVLTKLEASETSEDIISSAVKSWKKRIQLVSSLCTLSFSLRLQKNALIQAKQGF